MANAPEQEFCGIVDEMTASMASARASINRIAAECVLFSALVRVAHHVSLSAPVIWTLRMAYLCYP